MTRIYTFLLCLIFCSQLLAQDQSVFSSDIKTKATPWTNLEFQNDPNNFQFAIISDNTGGPAPGVLEDAIQKLNWLMPEFVVSVGDLIRGNSKNKKGLVKEWDQFGDIIAPLKMPFFHLAGNHDIRATPTDQKVGKDVMLPEWEKRFGRPYYHFRYRDVLFLALFTNEESGQTIGDEQMAYFEKVLDDNQDARWTIVLLHHPLWVYRHLTNFSNFEELLKGREYTVFAGHFHRYVKFERYQKNYYILATTGAGKEKKGPSFGDFHHITWVTMTDEGPVMANLNLDGIIPEDVTNTASMELAQSLIKSSQIETQVFTNPGETFERGKALLTINNESDKPLYLKGRFFHNHYVMPSKVKVEETIPASSKHTISFDLKAIKPFPVTDQMLLDFEGSLSYDLPEYPGLTLHSSSSLIIEPSPINILPSASIMFVDSYELNLPDPEAGLTLRYTLDGSEPTLDAPIFKGPITITQPTTIKARLFTEDGIASNIDETVFQPVSSGSGLVCKHYTYDRAKEKWNLMPDFDQMSPNAIKIEKEINMEKDKPQEETFGLAYRGYIELAESGIHQFEILSDDGVRLKINDNLVAEDIFKHKPRACEGKVELDAGKYTFSLDYFQHRREKVLEITYISPSGKKQKLKPAQFSYDERVFGETR